MRTRSMMSAIRICTSTTGITLGGISVARANPTGAAKTADDLGIAAAKGHGLDTTTAISTRRATRIRTPVQRSYSRVRRRKSPPHRPPRNRMKLRSGSDSYLPRSITDVVRVASARFTVSNTSSTAIHCRCSRRVSPVLRLLDSTVSVSDCSSDN